MPVSRRVAGRNDWSPVRPRRLIQACAARTGGEKQDRPQQKCAAELRRPRAPRTAASSMRNCSPGQRAANAADIRQAAGEVIDLARRLLPLALIQDQRRAPAAGLRARRARFKFSSFLPASCRSISASGAALAL